MLIIMKASATPENVRHVVDRLEELEFKTMVSKGDIITIIGAIGDKSRIEMDAIASMEGVKEVVPIREPYKAASREFQKNDTVIEFANGVKVGGGHQFVVMAGPCSIEANADLLFRIADAVKASGANFLRGGAFKPRTSPYDFQGLEEQGLKHLAEARERTGLLIITEVMDSVEAPLVAEYSDVLQVGARNMQNFKLLKAVGKLNKPVMLKRGLSATVREWLLAAEHIMYQGNHNVMLCERGIRSFDSVFTRNVLDLAIVPVLKKLSHLPVIVDPSHATGHRYLIPPMAYATPMTGADGIMMEVHPDPDKALSDGPQSLTLPQYAAVMDNLKKVVAFNKELSQPECLTNL